VVSASSDSTRRERKQSARLPEHIIGTFLTVTAQTVFRSGASL
jgi:hypothetical protein